MDVKDLEQEARVALDQAANKFKGRSDWRTFAWAVCFRRCHELTRKDFREDEFNGRDFSMPDGELGLEPETLTTLHRAVARLPPRQRKIISLHFGLDKPPPLKMVAVARRLGIHRNTAAPELRAALATLGQILPQNLLTQ